MIHGGGMDDLYSKFDSLVIPVTESGCHLWIGYTTAKGYGRIMYKRKSWGAHRLAWARENGAIPFGMFICHKCDTPQCVNPSHLFLGTHEDNYKDRDSKGRQLSGRQICSYRKLKLDEKSAMEVFLEQGGSKAVALKFGLSPRYVRSIKSKEAWAWIHD